MLVAVSANQAPPSGRASSVAGDWSAGASSIPRSLLCPHTSLLSGCEQPLLSSPLPNPCTTAFPTSRNPATAPLVPTTKWQKLTKAPGCLNILSGIMFNNKTSQELHILSSVTVNCQVTKIVTNPCSQLSVLLSVTQMSQVHVIAS